MDPKRRDTLLKLLYGPSLVGLRALASGIPASLLLAAETARADDFNAAARALAATARPPQYVIFSTSTLGDPLNCNAPGCYDDPSITHSADPSMAATPLALGGTSVKAARVWSTLPGVLLNQASFFHHGTYTVVHPDQNKVLKVQGATRGGEMLPSVLSKNLAGRLGTLRNAPVDFNSFSNGAITCNGVLQPSLTPGSLASLLSLPGGGLGDAKLVALRDKTVDRLNAFLKGQGKAYQGRVIDAYAQSREQTRTLQDSVVKQLQTITGNGADAQMKAAVLLFQMKVTPVVMVSLPFGGDNHDDPGFDIETEAHTSALATLGQLPAAVTAAGLTNRVTFCSLNVFGRTLTGAGGRSHNEGHSVSLIVGSNVRPGVVGGIAAAGTKVPYRARAIDSGTGAANDGGDVPYTDTLASYAKTLCAAAGVPDDEIHSAVLNGKIVAGALA